MPPARPAAAAPPARSSTQRSRGRPRSSVPAADRSQVLAAALRAIERHGAETTMDDVAAEAAVSKPIVYRMLGDRAALSVALSEWLIDRIDLATQAARDGAPTPRHRFRAVIRAYLVTVEQHADVYEFVNGGQPTPVLQRLAERSARALVEVFREVRRQAGLDVGGAETWAYAVVGALQMISTMSQGGPPIDPDVVSEDLARLMWDGLGAVVER